MSRALLLLALLWSSWHTSAVQQVHSTPVFTVDGKPFFVYGAAFFYERTPRAQWRRDLERYRAAGINTIDLYIIWNWHEPDAHTIDFDGHTNPGRDLRALFTTIHQLGFKVILRPGPVIRNEWRNGGYPDWLLERPEYNMPLHDILEGRYPATATLQNAHADAAADEWLHNPVHLRYAARWLHDCLHAVEPWSHDIIAIALDDDQGAYIDNDTYPAPHWHRYIDWLKSQVQQTTGSRIPLFINTYQMKVTASAPVWAWGNWYQSDAYRIGDHDLAQLAFSLGLLQTQKSEPVMTSEFQAGWLQGADQIAPRAAAPENTTIALHEMLQMGAQGVVNFPLQDTRNPAGWEAPWTNWFYGWDAAFDVDGNTSPRYAPTAAFGRLVTQYGSLLATMRPRADIALAWRGDMPATIAAQQQCRARAITCRLVDPRYGGRPGVLRGGSSTGGLRDAALLVAPDGKRALLDLFNAGTTLETTQPATITVGGRAFHIAAMRLAPGTARDIPLGFAPPPAPRKTPLPFVAPLPIAWLPVPHGQAIAYELDVYRDGSPTYVLDNGLVRAVVSANAGARSFFFEDERTQINGFTTIGAFRDDVQSPATPSPRDYIAAYTHPFPAGTFNRPYRCTTGSIGSSVTVDCTYTAPDLAAMPVTFDKRYRLDPRSPVLTVAMHSNASAVSISALAPDRIVREPYAAGETKVIRLTPQGPVP
jgi:hypothetical protein